MVHQKRFTKNHQRDYSRTSVYLSIIAFNLLPRSTLERRREREREERNTWSRIAFFRIIFFNSNKLRSTTSRLFNRIHFTSRCFLLLPVSLHDFLSLYIGVPLNIFFSTVFTAVQFSFPEHRVEWYSFNFRSPDGIHKVNRGKKRDSWLNNTTSHWALKAEDISFLIYASLSSSCLSNRQESRTYPILL